MRKLDCPTCGKYNQVISENSGSQILSCKHVVTNENFLDFLAKKQQDFLVGLIEDGVDPKDIFTIYDRFLEKRKQRRDVSKS